MSKTRKFFWSTFVVAILIALVSVIVYNVMGALEKPKNPLTFNECVQSDFDYAHANYPNAHFYGVEAMLKDSLSKSDTIEIAIVKSVFQVKDSVHVRIHDFTKDVIEVRDSVFYGHWGGLFEMKQIEFNFTLEEAFKKLKEQTQYPVPDGKFVAFNKATRNPQEQKNPYYVFGSILTSFVCIDCMDGSVHIYE